MIATTPPLSAAELALENAFAACTRRDEDAWPPVRPATGIAAVEIIWRLAAQFCDARALCALGATATSLYTASADVVPFLKDVTLFPHQRRGLRFMLRRERSGKGGGLLCDEPGTGKTLTVVALLLRTARLRSARPPEPARRLSGRVNARLARPTELKVRLKLGGKVAPETLTARDPKQRRRCGGTLIVAPTALVRHWRDELLRRAGGRRVDGFDLREEQYCRHEAYGFMAFDLHGPVWGNNIDSDPPLDVLVVSEERLSREFRSVTKKRYSLDDDAEDAADQSPLLKRAWRRVIVDEGRHAGDAASTNRLRLLSALTAESVWILTGTPTRGERGKVRRGEAALRQVGRLLRTVREAPHVSDLDGSLWQARVVTPLVSGSGDAAAAGALRDALRTCCVRHSAADLQLPAPIRIVSRLRPSCSEARSLNAFCAFVQANLYLTTLEVADVASMDDGYGASLLNPRNRRAAREAIDNILLCCAGGGEMVKLSRPEVLGELRYLRETV